MRYLFVILIIISTITPVSVVKAQEKVCFNKNEATDLIVLLESSKNDIRNIESCKLLVKQLEREIDLRDNTINKLTTEVVQARKENLEIKTKYERARTIAWYSGIATVVAVSVTLLSAL